MILSRLPFCRPLPATLNHFPDKRDSRVKTGERIGKVRQRGRAFLFSLPRFGLRGLECPLRSPGRTVGASPVASEHCAGVDYEGTSSSR
jgi:hypothetical protein